MAVHTYCPVRLPSVKLTQHVLCNKSSLARLQWAFKFIWVTMRMISSFLYLQQILTVFCLNPRVTLENQELKIINFQLEKQVYLINKWSGNGLMCTLVNSTYHSKNRNSLEITFTVPLTKQRKSLKELSLCNKLSFSNPSIFATQCCRM